MHTDTVSIDKFIADNGITMMAEWTDHNPYMDDDPKYPMDHWKCVLSRDRYKLTTVFSMGMGHNHREPNATEVLSSLVSDARSVKWDSFEGWCADMGYDTDSRRALRTYKACEHIGRRLERFLGGDIDDILRDVDMDY